MAKLRVAEEVFLITRGLSTDGTFRWKDWVNAHAAVYGTPVFSWQRNDKSHRHLHMTSGNMIRAQLRGGSIQKIARGLYKFVKNFPAYPLYVHNWSSSSSSRGY